MATPIEFVESQWTKWQEENPTDKFEHIDEASMKEILIKDLTYASQMDVREYTLYQKWCEIQEKYPTREVTTLFGEEKQLINLDQKKLIDKVKSIAQIMGVKHTVVLSHSQDTKKNPLGAEQKKKHLQRYSPNTHFETASKDKPTILFHAARLNNAGHDHLVVVAGSDRVKEMHHLLHKYNGVEAGHGKYHFKKITVHSAGHRDPDAEGAEGMSGTKMREHAKNKDFHSFRQGIPSHVSDHHAKELMNDVRKGMGLNEEHNRGLFKAIFITGGPNSGKDVIIREAIPESRAVELNTVQAYEYLADKQKLSEKTTDYRREAIRNRSPLIINGPAESVDKISYVKEELEEIKEIEKIEELNRINKFKNIKFFLRKFFWSWFFGSKNIRFSRNLFL